MCLIAEHQCDSRQLHRRQRQHCGQPAAVDVRPRLRNVPGRHRHLRRIAMRHTCQGLRVLVASVIVQRKYGGA
jgi:hypothetical protein